MKVDRGKGCRTFAVYQVVIRTLEDNIVTSTGVVRCALSVYKQNHLEEFKWEINLCISFADSLDIETEP